MNPQRDIATSSLQDFTEHKRLLWMGVEGSWALYPLVSGSSDFLGVLGSHPDDGELKLENAKP